MALRSRRSDDILEVSDDGVGMRRSLPGDLRGLGMSHMEERARILGGELTIESEPGQGTTVRVSIPRRAVGGGPSPAGESGGERDAP